MGAVVATDALQQLLWVLGPAGAHGAVLAPVAPFLGPTGRLGRRAPSLAPRTVQQALPWHAMKRNPRRVQRSAQDRDQRQRQLALTLTNLAQVTAALAAVADRLDSCSWNSCRPAQRPWLEQPQLCVLGDDPNTAP